MPSTPTAFPALATAEERPVARQARRAALVKQYYHYSVGLAGGDPARPSPKRKLQGRNAD
jgi:hypothetical protein